MLLDLKAIPDVYINGVLHVGAHVGEEFELYQQLGIKNIVFFEPLPFVYATLIDRLSPLIKDESVRAYCYALANFTGEAEIFVSMDERQVSQSSSLLAPKEHLTQHPNVKFPTKQLVSVQRMDDIVKGDLDLGDFNFMNVDVQGYELEVFKGAAKTLEGIDYIISEVNNSETYENCALVEEVDAFLARYGFVREITSWDGGIWGDAFYRKIK